MLNIKNDDIIKISRKKGKKNDRIFFCQIELHTSFFCLKIQNNTKNCKRLKKKHSTPTPGTVFLLYLLPVHVSVYWHSFSPESVRSISCLMFLHTGYSLSRVNPCGRCKVLGSVRPPLHIACSTSSWPVALNWPWRDLQQLPWFLHRTFTTAWHLNLFLGMFFLWPIRYIDFEIYVPTFAPLYHDFYCDKV